MSVASHLGIRVRDYDRHIRTFIPHYAAILDAAADAVHDLARPRPMLLDLGIGSGALAARCLARRPDAHVLGIDEDESMLALAHKRLGARVTTVTGDFLKTPLPSCDVITASFSLHHVFERRRKAQLYRKCFRALRSGGVLVNADCCLASAPALQRRDREAWLAHLRRTYTASKATALLHAWGKEDRYFLLEDELALMRSAGFRVDVRWRRGSFAVVAGIKSLPRPRK